VEKKMWKDRGIAPPKGAWCLGGDGFLPGSESRVSVPVTECIVRAIVMSLLGKGEEYHLCKYAVTIRNSNMLKRCGKQIQSI